MQRLVLMRHAKAEAHNREGDFARHLTSSGTQDASLVGRGLADVGIDLALVSGATRTRETFEALALTTPVTYLDSLYSASASTLSRLISATADSVTSLLVVGHAPTIPEVAARLLDSIDEDEAFRVRSSFPTATVATFSFNCPWQELFNATDVTFDGLGYRA